MKKRINIFRSIAIILIILNSIWTLSGGRIFEHALILPFIELCGEVGVTALFVSFGYEMFGKLGMEENGSAKDTGYLRTVMAGFKYIAPEYYIFFIATLVISGSGYFKATNLGNILAHVFCLQGYLPEYAEAINPTLWIIGLFVWFIVLAKPIYKLMRMKRIGNAVPFIFVALSVITRFLLTKHFGFAGNPWVNENILTTIEAFVIGMYIARAEEEKEDSEKTDNKTCVALLAFGLILIYFACIRVGGLKASSGATVYGYVFHSFISALIALLIYFANMIKLKDENKEGIVQRCFGFLAEHVYAIIICHRIVIRFLLTHFDSLQRIMQNGVVRFAGLTVIALLSGFALKLVGDVVRKAWDSSKLLKRIITGVLVLATVVLTVLCGVNYSLPSTDEYILTQYDDDSGAQAMFYTIYTPQKKLIVIDGGYRDNTEHVRNTINSYGGYVDSWIVTHPHPDHVGVLNEILKNPGGISIGNIYAIDLPYEKYKGLAQYWDAIEYYEEFLDLTKSMKNIHYVHTGDELKLSGIDMKVISAYSDYVGQHSYDLCNDGSMMFKLTFKNESVLFCADVGETMSNHIISESGNELRSDYVQMGHHGYGGLSEEFYRVVSPKGAFFDAPDWLINEEQYGVQKKIKLIESLGGKVYHFGSAPNEVRFK